VTILRIPGVYGQAPHDHSIIGQIVSAIRTKRRVTIHGDGARSRDYIYLDDLCRLLDVLLSLRYNGVLNVGTGQGRRFIDIVHLVGNVLNLNVEIEYAATDPERDFDLLFDLHKLKSLLPTFQFTDMADGIRSYL